MHRRTDGMITSLLRLICGAAIQAVLDSSNNWIVRKKQAMVVSDQ
jgi:hypothetical protein